MPTGLKLKQGVVKIGGLAIQPIKPIVAQIASPLVLKPKPLRLSKPRLRNAKIIKFGDKLKLSSLRMRRAQLLAEKGINIFRPEIIAATRFAPVYVGEQGGALAPTGQMLDLQICSRSLRLTNINNFIKKLNEDEDLAALLGNLERDYLDNLEQANADTQFMVDTYRALDDVLKQFNIFGNRHILRRKADRILGESSTHVLNLQELFVEHLGFSQEGFNHFSNTKILGQMTFDLTTAIRRYTPGLFNIIDADRPNDLDPLKYDRSTTLTDGKFTFDIANFSRENRTLNAFDLKTFSRLTRALPSSRESRMKLLSVTLSRLLGISGALAKRDIQSKLRRLDIDVNASDPIAELVGTPGETILDEPDQNSSILNAFRIDDSSSTGTDVILPFEKRYIIDSQGRRFAPGDDYFFDGLVGQEDSFDIARLIDFNRTFKSRLVPALDILDAAARTSTPAARAVWGTQLAGIRSDTIFNRMLRSASSILERLDKTDRTMRNYAFILAVFDMAQGDRQLRRLLFQLMFMSVIWNDRLGSGDAEPIEIVEEIIGNEVSIFNDLPALNNVTIEVPRETNEPEFGFTEEENIGLLPIRTTRVLTAAYKHIQRLIVDRTFDLLSRRGKIGNVLFIGKTRTSSLAILASNRAKQINTPLGSPSTTTRKTAVNFNRPTAANDFSEDFRDIMLVMARFVDETEDIAGGKSLDHLLPDRSGRSRYLAISSSTRLLLGFEMIATVLGSYGFSKFGNLNSSNQVKIEVDRSLAKTFSAATNVKSQLLGTRFKTLKTIKFLNPKNVNQHNGRATRSRIASTSVIAQPNHINDGLLEEFKAELSGIKQSLREDRFVIESMSATLRALTVMLDEAVDNVAQTLGTKNKQPNEALSPFKIGPLNRTRKRGTSRAARNNAPARRPRRTQSIRKFRIIPQNLKQKADKREKIARRLLLSRQQAALALIKLRDISSANVKFSPTNLKNTQVVNAAQTPFSDDSNVTQPVQNALWSMLSAPQFRGADGQVSKILSVGIPAGFVDRLEDSDKFDELDFYDHLGERQLDMISVDVHRKDITEEDIVFKPQKFIFEMSRFVSSFSFTDTKQRNIQKPIRYQSTVTDFTQFIDLSSFSLGDIRGQLGEAVTKDERYSFMTLHERRQMIYNHATSYLLGVYLRMLTGVDMRESSFLVEPNAIASQDNQKSEDIFVRIAEKLVERESKDLSLGDLRSRFPEFDELLQDIEEGEFMPGILENQLIIDKSAFSGGNSLVTADLTDLALLTSSKSNITGGERQRRAITSPKLFERILNVIVDPFSFEIDIEKTNSTTSGRYALLRLKAAARIIETRNTNTNEIKFSMRRPPVERDVTIDQYFTVISRYEPPTSSREQATKLARSRRLSPRPVTNQRSTRVGLSSVYPRTTSTKVITNIVGK